MSHARTGRASAVAAALALLAGCTVPPPVGPSVLALPAQGKDFARFQREDAGCRDYAAGQSGSQYASDAATRNAAGSAVVGTLLGAAAGAVIGAAAGNVGAGAAIGAGSGLALGGVSGANAAGYQAAGVQERYDIAYSQCQYANGNAVQGPQPYLTYPAPYRPYYAY